MTLLVLLITAACAFVLLVLAFALVRGGVASAHGKAAHKHPRQHTATGLLSGLGGVVTGLGHTVDGVLSGVGAALGHQPQSHPAPHPTPHPTAHPTPPPSSHPAPKPTPTTQPAGGHTTPAAVPSSAPAAHGSAVAVAADPGNAARHAGPAVRVAATSPAQKPAPVTSLPHIASALGSPRAESLGFSLTASLAALMFAMVLGVGLLVYRAGDRGERAA